MSTPFDPLAAALDLAAQLESRVVDYAIGGALALSVWSEPRATNDVDLNVFVEPADLGPVFEAIESVGATVDRVVARRQAESRGMFIARWPSGHALDVFTPSIDFSWEAARTRVRRTIAGREAWFLGPTAIAVFKLLFFRGKDRVDLERYIQIRTDQGHAGCRVRTRMDRRSGRRGRRAGPLPG